MDESPVWSDTPGSYTYDFEGARCVPVRTTGHTKDRITVVFCISWTGEKLPPLIVFKSTAKNQPLLVRHEFNGKVIYSCGQASAYNDGRVMALWVKEIFARRNNSTAPAILTMDNVKFHSDNTVQDALRAQNVIVSNFPPNTTCRLQPLDHSINGVVKKKLDEYWSEWMNNEAPALTCHGNLQKPQRDETLGWVGDAWFAVTSDTIKKSFNSCWKTEDVDDHDIARPSTTAVATTTSDSVSVDSVDGEAGVDEQVEDNIRDDDRTHEDGENCDSKDNDADDRLMSSNVTDADSHSNPFRSYKNSNNENLVIIALRRQ